MRPVRIPAATNGAVREKLEHERTLITQLLATGTALQQAGRSSPTFATDLRALRIQGAELSSVTGDAAGEITKDSRTRLSDLVLVEIVLGLLSAAAFALSAGYLAYYLRGGPRIIDATSYWLQARALAEGHPLHRRVPTRDGEPATRRL